MDKLNLVNLVIIICFIVIFCANLYEYIHLENNSPAYDAFIHGLWNKFQGALLGFAATILYMTRTKL